MSALPSATVLKTGRPKCSVPPFFGVTPPTCYSSFRVRKRKSVNAIVWLTKEESNYEWIEIEREGTMLVLLIIPVWAQNLNDDKKAQAGMILWTARNQKLWHNASFVSKNVLSRVKHILAEWQTVKAMQLPNTQFSNQYNLTWAPPMAGILKCNLDAAFWPCEQKTGWGYCVINNFGNFVYAKTDLQSTCHDVTQGEALGLLQALKWIHSLGYEQVVFEMDCRIVVDKLMSHYCDDDSKLGGILVEFNNILSTHQNFVVQFIKRQANTVAHSLARTAIQNAYYVFTTMYCSFGYEWNALDGGV